MAARELAAALAIEMLDQMRCHVRFVRHPLCIADPFKRLQEFLLGLVGHHDLVPQATQESLVGQFGRVQVGGEYGDLVEADFQLLAGMQT